MALCFGGDWKESIKDDHPLCFGGDWWESWEDYENKEETTEKETTEKFTHGEWHSGIDAEDKRPYIFCGGSPQEIIADVFVPNQCIEQAIANAALISVAPEMYRVLEQIEDVMNDSSDCGTIPVDKIEAVLKKARGEE